jgi:hypothetical protein
MSQSTSTFLLRGGLNLVTPPLAIPPGMAIASINYSPDVAGYTRLGGYERFDGLPRPSDSDVTATIASRRAAISTVPGTGPVRGVTVFDGYVYAFRDHADGDSRMYRSSATGWERMTFGSEITFTAGTAEFVEGEILVGGTSGATATIKRVVLRTGAWSGTATGYLVLSGVVGTFQAETVTSSSGSATIAGDATAITLATGGVYDFTTHNFYGAGKRPRLYGSNGQGFAFEWDGEVLAPIRTGTAAGVLEGESFLLAANGDFLLAANGDSIILRFDFDRPQFVSHYKNHLFLAYSSGSIIFSSIGEPLEYITTTGAGEVSFGEAVTGLLTAASTSIVIFGQNRIEYVTGNDSSDFVMSPISDGSGAVAYSAQMLNRPIFLDDGGLRDLGTTAAFGDWRAGSLSQAIEPLMRAKRDAGATVAASVLIRAKDQYRLFWNDGTGITLYVGRKQPESMPFNLPIVPFCACYGEVTQGAGDRLFVGAEDGYVYELERGLSFDGEAIEAYVRLPFNSIGSPTQRKRFSKFTAGVDSEDAITLGVKFDIDYAVGTGGAQVDKSVAAGTATVSTGNYDEITWSSPVQGTLEEHIAGIGRNCAVTLISDAADKRVHTLQSASFNFSPRNLIR